MNLARAALTREVEAEEEDEGRVAAAHQRGGSKRPLAGRGGYRQHSLSLYFVLCFIVVRILLTVHVERSGFLLKQQNVFLFSVTL